jgi:hypothetical protein
VGKIYYSITRCRSIREPARFSIAANMTTLLTSRREWATAEKSEVMQELETQNVG